MINVFVVFGIMLVCFGVGMVMAGILEHNNPAGTVYERLVLK